LRPHFTERINHRIKFDECVTLAGNESSYKASGFHTYIVALILAFSLSSASASKQRALSESIRIKRLGGLGRLWGAIKYSHPKLATEDIDWDKALVETIPLVNAAENPIQYKQAIDHLLAFLSDPITRSEFIDSGKNPVTNGGKSDAGDYLQTRNGAVVVEVAGLNTLRAQSGQKVLNEAIQQMLVKAENASGIVFDCRNFGVDLTSSDKFFLDQSLISLTQPLISKDIHLGTSRYRYYSGYPPYSIKTSGNYSTGIMSSSVEILKGSAVKGFRKPSFSNN